MLSSWLRRKRFNRFGRQQGAGFEQPAEIFLAGVLMRAVGKPKVGGRFIADFEPFEVDDAHELFIALPNLALF